MNIPFHIKMSAGKFKYSVISKEKKKSYPLTINYKQPK